MTRPSSHFEVRFAEDADGEAINALFNRVFEEERSLEEYHWKFGASPWAGVIPPAVIGNIEKRLVAAFGLLPHRFWCGGQELTAVQVVDVCVDPEHRRGGINRATLEFSLQHGEEFAPIAFGFPGRTYAQIGMEKLAYRLLSVIHAYATEPGCGTQSGPQPLGTDMTIDDAGCLDRDWSPLLAVCAERGDFSTQRTMNYLRWRYKEFSHRKHRFVTALRAGALEGAAVVRIADGRHGWRIFELLAVSAEAVQKLLSHVCRSASDCPRPVTYWCSQSAPWQDELGRFGFQRIDAGPAHAVGLPLGRPSLEVERCFEEPHWFFTLGDSDL